MSLRDVHWSISLDRYRELRYFCVQYQSKKKLLLKDPSEKRRERLIRDIRIIEESAMYVCAIAGIPDEWGILLESVTENVGYGKLRQRYYYLPFNKSDFAGARRAFFNHLDELQFGAN